MLTAQASAGAPERHARLEVERRLHQLPGAQAEHDAQQPADERQRGGLDQELPQDLPPGGAERLAQPDLAGPVGHRDHHDRHHADAAHQQRDARERDHRQEEVGGELPDHVENLVLRDEVEGVGHRRAGARGRGAARPWPGRARPPGSRPGRGPHGDEQVVGLVVAVVLARGLERNDAADLLARRLEDVVRFLVDADDPERRGPHPHVPARAGRAGRTGGRRRRSRSPSPRRRSARPG